MDIHLVNHAFASIYNDHLKNIIQLTGNWHLVDSWSYPSITDKYYQSMEKALREMSLKVPEQRYNPANNDPSAQHQIIENSQLKKAADRVGWLNIIDEPLAVQFPLLCTEFIRNFSTHLSKRVPIVVKVSFW